MNKQEAIDTALEYAQLAGLRYTTRDTIEHCVDTLGPYWTAYDNDPETGDMIELDEPRTSWVKSSESGGCIAVREVNSSTVTIYIKDHEDAGQKHRAEWVKCSSYEEGEE